VQALQSSFDTIRRYRPEYSPRTGFVWPIVDSVAQQDSNVAKASKTRESSVIETADSVAATKDNDQNLPSTSTAASKKHEDISLMWNALHTAVAHTRSQPPPASLPDDASDVASETLSQTSGQPPSSAPRASFSVSGAPGPEPTVGVTTPRGSGNGSGAPVTVKKRKKSKQYRRLLFDMLGSSINVGFNFCSRIYPSSQCNLEPKLAKSRNYSAPNRSADTRP
jgi:mediator of RNA polymerase II transcription subunit 6